MLLVTSSESAAILEGAITLDSGIDLAPGKKVAPGTFGINIKGSP